jgi:2-dehydropantoate 2-reductase
MTMDEKQPKILFFGAGVIGGSVAGWLAPHCDNLFLLDQGETAVALKRDGITLYLGSEPDKKQNVKVNVIDSIEQAADADIIVLGVKNYSLEPVAKMLKEKTDGRAVIVSMANGCVNQEVLPKYFSRVIYCVVSYNAWMDKPGVIGYQKKGPLIIGTPDNSLQAELKQVSDIFNRAVETVVTPHFQDAVHCKIVINLTNSVTTLVGHRFREISDPAAFQRILSGLLWEGVEIVKAADHHECKLGGMPSWALLWLGAKLPHFVTKPMFDRNVKKMVMSSMAQDVIQRGGKDNELESINGYIVGLADRLSMKAPFNRTVYAMCKREFAKPDFQPLDVKGVWAEIAKAVQDGFVGGD